MFRIVLNLSGCDVRTVDPDESAEVCRCPSERGGGIAAIARDDSQMQSAHCALLRIFL
jgi:hypothetical protein